MEDVVAPLDQRYPLAGDEVNVNTVPGHTFNEPFAVTTGVVGEETIEAKNSTLTHKPTGRTMTYGSIASEAANVSVPAPLNFVQLEDSVPNGRPSSETSPTSVTLFCGSVIV